MVRRAGVGLRSRYPVVLSTVAISIFGIVGLRGMELPGPSPVTDADRLKIEVFERPDPPVEPGALIDVGEVVDAFDGVTPRPPPPEADTWAWMPEWDEESEPVEPLRDRIRSVAEVLIHGPPPPEAPPHRAGGRWFGFDAPRRDYQAERAARQARLEAIERWAREQRRREVAGFDEHEVELRPDERRWPNPDEDREPVEEEYAAADPVPGFSE